MKPVRFRVIREAAARIKHMVTWGSKEDDGNGNRAGRHHPILTRGVIVLVLAGIIVGVSLIVASPQEGHLDTGVARATASDVRLLVVGGDGSIDIPPGSPLRQQLVIRAVELKDVAQTLDFPAVVEADPATTAKLSPPLAGRIVELRVGLGDRVQKGQIVAVLKSADLAQAYNDYDKAQSALALARRTLDRQRGLTAIRAGATKDLEAAQDTFTQAEAESRRAAARLDQIGAPATARGAGEGLLNITAPVSGTVTDLSAARGTYFNDPTQPLMTVSQLDMVWVTASVSEKDIAFVSRGQAAEVRLLAYPGEVFTGSVSSTGDIVDPDTRRMKVRIEFQNLAGRLKPGMFGSVRFIAPPKKIAMIPSTALVLKNDTDSVFVETGPWRFEARPVTTQGSFGDEVTITQGVAAGERVVIKGGVFLND